MRSDFGGRNKHAMSVKGSDGRFGRSTVFCALILATVVSIDVVNDDGLGSYNC